MRVPDNMKKRDVMIALKSKSDNELEKLYMEYNTQISLVRGMAKGGLLVHYNADGTKLSGGYKLRNYNIAVKNRARILTILNQRRHERIMRQGIK